MCFGWLPKTRTTKPQKIELFFSKINLPLWLCKYPEKFAVIMREIMWYLLSIRRNRNNKITVVKAKPRLTNGGCGFVSVPFSITNKVKEL